MIWKHPSSPVTNIQQSATKVMATVFWDSCGMILLDILPKGESVNAGRYCKTLDRLKHAVRLLEANYQAMIWRRATETESHPDVSAPVHNGWKFENDSLVIDWGEEMFPREITDVLEDNLDSDIDDDIEDDLYVDIPESYDSDE
ncbi:histone-lysine N-methyltransferase SETMAR [Plakobranchus ocellatus]|uniref:Histone-lysine N-methyltransferase SETMAR n=1 Tax=Plakobranchus ocellatus TaxID=259542 RepID=A0AAV3YYH1_9GAST|nr:histone-lysine N-methyltransferase SETMAR [Plakobranchus ocellatus]